MCVSIAEIHEREPALIGWDDETCAVRRTRSRRARTRLMRRIHWTPERHLWVDLAVIGHLRLYIHLARRIVSLEDLTRPHKVCYLKLYLPLLWEMMMRSATLPRVSLAWPECRTATRFIGASGADGMTADAARMCSQSPLASRCGLVNTSRDYWPRILWDQASPRNPWGCCV
ncbi:hypothetical protein BKA93DRAFT_485684 [Sparassis latifolia]